MVSVYDNRQYAKYDFDQINGICNVEVSASFICQHQQDPAILILA